MNQITQFFSNLKADFDKLNQSIDELVKTYNAIVHFLDLISNLFPIDLVLVLVISLPILYLINTLSPTTSRTNYSIAVISVSALRSFFAHAIGGSWDLLNVSKTALLLLLPAYGFLVLKAAFQFLQEYRTKKKALRPKNLEASFLSLQNAYHGLSAQIYGSLEKKNDKDFIDPVLFSEKIKSLEDSISGLKDVLSGGKKDIAKPDSGEGLG